MTTFRPALTGLIRRQRGVVSIEQLIEHGISRAERRTLVASGLIESIHRGVYILATADRTLEARAVAACLACPRLVICGPTAGRLMGIRRTACDDVHAVTGAGITHLDGVVLHRTNELDFDTDVIVRPDGIRILSAERWVFDIARYVDDISFESILEQLLDRREVTVPALFATGRRLQKSGREGSARFARVLAKRPLWAKPKDSTDEVKVLRALAERGVALVPQFELELPDGSVIHLDGADPTRRFGVEVDHVTWHGGRAPSQYDKWRDRQTTRMGWAVARVTDEDLSARWAATINDLLVIHQGRTAV
jgi:hypothetical protein